MLKSSIRLFLTSDLRIYSEYLGKMKWDHNSSSLVLLIKAPFGMVRNCHDQIMTINQIIEYDITYQEQDYSRNTNKDYCINLLSYKPLPLSMSTTHPRRTSP